MEMSRVAITKDIHNSNNNINDTMSMIVTIARNTASVTTDCH